MSTRFVGASSLALVVLSLGVSCGRSDLDMGEGDGGPYDAALLDARSDASVSPDGTAIDSGEDAPVDAGPLVGLVSFYDGVDPLAKGQFGAAFYRQVTAPQCAPKSVGECTVVKCGPGIELKPSSLSAGTLTIEGPAFGSTPLSPDPTSNGWYDYTRPSPLFAANDLLTVSATGADVPAFQASVVGAGQIRLTAPMAGTVPVSQDLPVAWSGGAGGQIAYVVVGGLVGGSSLSVTCTFDAAKGSGIVPAATFAELATGDPSNLFVWEETDTRVQAGAFTITVSSATPSSSTLVFFR